MKILKKNEKNFHFDVRILRNIEKELYKEEKEIIEETTANGSEMYSLVTKVFKNVLVYNENKEIININQFKENEKYRWFFCCGK